MNNNELTMLQSLPLDVKIMKTQLRLREYVEHYGIDNVYISFSGGKDSTVLLDIARKIYPTIKAMFINTGLEFPEIVKFVKDYENVDIIKPKLTFKEVIEKYGYPVVSKEQSHYIYLVKNSKSIHIRNKHLYGINKDGSKTNFTIAKKWVYLLDSPFKIGDGCCEAMKKRPAKSYEKITGKKPIIGSLASESTLRKSQYLKTGCNVFDTNRPHSKPMSFWTEQDILKYIIEHKIEIASVYGKIIEVDGKLKTTKYDRTGCVYCAYGIHKDDYPNRFQRLEITHPQLHKYCMENLGFKDVCEYMKIPYKN